MNTKHAGSIEVPKEIHTAIQLNPLSFVNLGFLIQKNIQLNAPYPSYLTYDETVNLYPDKSLGYMYGYEIKENQGVVSKDEDIIKRQSGVFAEMAKQLAKGLFKSGVISISLPIKIFEPRGMLERYSDWFAFSPVLLKKGGSCGDKVEAFKYAICFALAGLFFSTGQLKPFNPLLGETWEGSSEDGTSLYFEHTSHTPCISNYQIIDSDNLYMCHGYFDISIEGALKIVFNNSVTCVQRGKANIYFKKTNQTISYQYPKIILGGMIMGSRYALYDGHMKFEDKENNMKAVIYFNKSHPNIKNRRFHDFYGQIFHYDFSKQKKDEPFFEPKVPKNPFPSDKKQTISEITGSWLELVVFDNSVYWTISDNFPPQILTGKNVLPSDSRYREDLIWLKRCVLNSDYKDLYEDYSQKWKLALEAQQRHDRALREKFRKK